MNYTFLALTALTVSVDSFFVGIALSLKNKRYFSSVFCVLTTVFILCLLGSLSGKILGEFLNEYAQTIAGVILVLIGFLGIFKKERQNNQLNSIKNSVIVGFSVGIDGMVGSFSLTAIGYNEFLVAVLITLIHVILLVLSCLIGNKLFKKLSCESKLPSIILVLLGLYKIIA